MSSDLTPEQRVTAAAADVEQQRSKLAEWEATKATAQAELEDLQQRAGTEVLDSPDSATTLARSLQELRDRIDIAERAVDAQRPRVIAAEQAYLTAEADHLEATALAPAQEALDKHEARTEKLLADLEAHEGKYVPESELRVARHQPGVDGPLTIPATKGSRLKAEMTRVSRQVQVLRHLAAGEDPQPLINEWSTWRQALSGAAVYPPCVWGPGALVPATEYLRQIKVARQRAAELEDLAEQLPAKIRRLERERAELPPHVGRRELATARARAATIDRDRERAAAGLAGLTGDTASPAS